MLDERREEQRTFAPLELRPQCQSEGGRLLIARVRFLFCCDRTFPFPPFCAPPRVQNDRTSVLAHSHSPSLLLPKQLALAHDNTLARSDRVSSGSTGINSHFIHRLVRWDHVDFSIASGNRAIA